VQHPKAEPLKLAFDTDAIIGINENGTTVKYKTNTQPGSSGSPCFDINWNLVALHHSGDPDRRNPTYNAGTPFSAICSRLERQGLLADLRNGQPIW
jgi:V8-like Glu-specific endopeptidase